MEDKDEYIDNEELERLSFIINEIDNPIIIADKQLNIEWVSPSFVKTFGFTLEEFIKHRGSASLNLASYNSNISRVLNEAIRQRRSMRYESRNFTKDGRELWMSSTIKPVWDKDGDLHKILIVDLDVQEKKKMEDKLVLTDSILQKIGTLVLVADSAGKIVYVSPSVTKVVGYTSKEMLGDGWWNLSRKTQWDSEKEKTFVARCASGELSISEEPYERPITTKNGKTRWILWKDTKGPNNLIIGVGHDITERKYNEELMREKNKDITDSIHYAHRIQNAIFPVHENLLKHFPQSFVLFKPKDIVSGDFLWFGFPQKLRSLSSHKILVAVADCTGHGVPGALMSIIGTGQINHIIKEKGVIRPDRVLRQLNRRMKDFLKQKEETDTRDGMDIAICHINPVTLTIEFSGANRSLYLFRKGILRIYSGNKTAIGGITDNAYVFKSQVVHILPGDVIYMFTDGYADQFGGPKGKKFMIKRFKTLLESIHKKTMKEQETILTETIKKWKGNHEQVDDILIVGIRF